MVDGPEQPTDARASDEAPAEADAEQAAARAAAISEAAATWPAVAYFAVGPQPIVGPPPAWSRTYDLPSARKVVSAGLQLAVASTRTIRRASIYIGLLSLGAFGPSVILLLVGIGRLMTDPATADTIASDPSLLLFDQPEILGSFVLVYALFIVGFVLLVAIGIDSQAIAISLLAGAASGQPLRLWEAVIRARQVFWRLLGTGILVGLVSGVISLVLTFPFLRPYDTNQGISFIGQMVGILAVTPFAFASTGIVLGDVGPIETLKRSVRLFRARKRIALVVTLFTLVTAAIQTFAILGGLDLAVRVAEVLHLGLDQGALASILLGVVILAFIVAYGSLAFTIAAIVAAPQVAGFLGITFYSGGLDRARTAGEAKPKGFRWVTVPMTVVMGLLVLAGVVGLPSMLGLQAKPPSVALTFLRAEAHDRTATIDVFGSSHKVDDPVGDLVGDGGGAGGPDLVRAEAAYLPNVPDWLLDDVFDCAQSSVACGRGAGGHLAFSDGALLFVHRLVAPIDHGVPQRVAVLLAAPGSASSPRTADDPFSDASHAYVTRIGAPPSLSLEQYNGSSFVEATTRARSTWSATDVFTLVPFEETDEPYGWDAIVVAGLSASGQERGDTARSSWGTQLLSWNTDAWIFFVDVTAPGSFAP